MRTQLHHLISVSAAARPDAPAITVKDSTLSYAQLWRQVIAVAGGLRRLGLGRGERVGVYLDKRDETVPAIFGTSAAGGAFVPVNPLLRPRQVAYILADCDVRILVTSAERWALLREEVAQCKALEQVILVGTPPAEPANVDPPAEPANVEPPAGAGAIAAVLSWAELIAGMDATLVPALGSPTDLDLAAIFYTSGSTGRPKGVVLSHRNLLVGAQSVSHYLANTAEDVMLAALPLSFDAGFSQLTTAFAVGAHVVLVNYLLPADVVRLCARHQVTGLTCVPPLWLQLAEQSWPPEATRSLRYFANTGGRMPRATLSRLREIFPQALPFLMYGLTEAFRSTYLDPSEVDRRPDSIGKAIPNAEILVVRPDGSICDPGEEGELVHRGPLVALGYWNDPERTAVRFRPAPGREPGICTTEVAVFSGDAVVRDEEGFLYFVGRTDEMIKTSGYRVSPTEIEEVVYDTGLVRDAVALGVDDPRIGQHIVVVASPPDGGELDPAVLLAELKRALPMYMLPRQIVVRAQIPRSPNGKFDRNRLREEFAS
ncbi:MAG TPA: acyl-CoA ligase (AMP-forming), exosortase A system-associated [Micromonosporaceae bacterium]